VSHCGAVGALDWGGATAAAAVDGGQEGRRRSGEGVSSGKGKCDGKEVQQRVIRSQSGRGARVKARRGAEGTSRSWQRWRGRGGRAELRAAGARANRDSREGETRPGKGEDDAWSSSQQEVVRRWRQSGGQLWQNRLNCSSSSALVIAI
jgi:hypothetical protein